MKMHVVAEEANPSLQVRHHEISAFTTLADKQLNQDSYIAQELVLTWVINACDKSSEAEGRRRVPA